VKCFLRVMSDCEAGILASADVLSSAPHQNGLKTLDIGKELCFKFLTKLFLFFKFRLFSFFKRNLVFSQKRKKATVFHNFTKIQMKLSSPPGVQVLKLFLFVADALGEIS